MQDINENKPDSTSASPNSPDHEDVRNHSTAVTDGKKALHVIGEFCKVVIPMGISVALVIWLFHKVNIHDIKQVMANGMRFEFIAMMMFLTMLSFILRGIRWGIQLRAAGVPRMSPVAECVSIFSAYAINLIIQFLGEAWRCIYVARKEKVKLSTIVGTDLGDRGSDFVMILSIIGLTLGLASTQIHHFFQEYPLGRFLEHLVEKWWLYTGIILVLVLFILADRKWKNTKFFSGVNLSISRIWDGFKVLFYMKGKWAYLWFTLGIWTCYFLETYLCFFSFPFTRELITMPGSAYGLVPGLVVFVFGAMSMLVPSNGGLGPWNVAVMYALMLYGVSNTDAAAYSLVVWACQALMIVALGIFSAIYIIVTRNSTKRAQELQTEGHEQIEKRN